MPTVFIWPPKEKDNPYGHVALKTDLYYISFWTAQVLESDENDDDIHENEAKTLKRKFTKTLGGIGVFKGHRGGLVIHQDLDKEYEGDCYPIEYDISITVSDEEINSIYEEFLHYNEINPEDVTLTRGEQLFKKNQEYWELVKSLPEEVKGREEPKLPQRSLVKTEYSFSAELVDRKEEDESLPFYHKQQSCVSFAFNLIQMAWLKQHPDRPIPILFKTPGVLIAPNIVCNNESGDMGEYAYEVPWFQEQVAENYLLKPDMLLQDPSVAALKISLGIVTRPFKRFFSVIFVASFLLFYFSLFGFLFNVLIVYRYGCQLDTIFRADQQQMKEILSIRLNYWMLSYIIFMYYGNIFMTLFHLYYGFIFLLDITSIEFTFSMITTISFIIVSQEQNLSIIKETTRAITPLIYLLMVGKRGFSKLWLK